MSIRIIAKGTRLYKLTEGNDENGPFKFEVEVRGEEKAFYLKEIGLIDQGKGDGAKIGNDHRDYCECQECVKGA